MNKETQLYRQVNPAWVQQGRITSQAFKPTPKDQKRLSVYDGDLLSAEEAWSHYNAELGFSSVGVLAVSCAECEDLELPVVSDPTPFLQHALICFDACTASQIERKAKKLRARAEERGWLYQATAG